MNNTKIVFILLLAIIWSTCAIAETSNVDVTITAVDSRQSTITVSYDGKSRQLKLAPAALFEIDGKEGSLGSLLPGDMAVVTYDREKSLVTRITVQRDAMIPAEKLPEGWDQIDQRLLFLMVRLANVETSLDAIEQVIDGQSRRSTVRSADAKRADRANEELDRKGGGPVKWSQFYGMTAEQFFYHPTDRNSTYHTVTVLNQQGSQADNKVGGGVPASQGLPVHQRPPQFDYIYKANERAKARAEADASELKGKIEQLSARRQRLEAEQAGLWVEIAFRAISHYDLDKKPLYRFEPLMMASDTDSRKRTEAMKSASVFMALALSIIKDAEKNQAATFTRIKPMVAEARQALNDTYLKLALDVTDRKSAIGRFSALAKRLEDVASNLTDSYVVAMEGDSAKDRQRKETFRATLQGSLLSYAQIVLAMDEMSSLLQYEYGYQPDTEKPFKLVGSKNIDLGVQMPSITTTTGASGIRVTDDVIEILNKPEPLTEINTEAEGSVLQYCLSSNGLEIFWCSSTPSKKEVGRSENSIWTARRISPNHSFGRKTNLFKGHSPTLGYDDLSLYVFDTKDQLMLVSNRSDTESIFGPLKPFASEFTSRYPDKKLIPAWQEGPTSFFVMAKEQGMPFLKSFELKRESPAGDWNKHKLLVFEKPEKFEIINIVSSFPTTDGSRYLCRGSYIQQKTATLMNGVMTRNPLTGIFSSWREINIKGFKPTRLFYLSSTKELYFISLINESDKMEIWVIKDVDLTNIQ